MKLVIVLVTAVVAIAPLHAQTKGDGYAGCQLRLTDPANTTIVAESTTDANGLTQFNDLTPGEYLLHIDCPSSTPTLEPVTVAAPPKAGSTVPEVRIKISGSLSDGSIYIDEEAGRPITKKIKVSSAKPDANGQLSVTCECTHR